MIILLYLCLFEDQLVHYSQVESMCFCTCCMSIYWKMKTTFQYFPVFFSILRGIFKAAVTKQPLFQTILNRNYDCLQLLFPTVIIFHVLQDFLAFLIPWTPQQFLVILHIPSQKLSQPGDLSCTTHGILFRDTNHT